MRLVRIDYVTVKVAGEDTACGVAPERTDYANSIPVIHAADGVDTIAHTRAVVETINCLVTGLPALQLCDLLKGLAVQFPFNTVRTPHGDLFFVVQDVLECGMEVEVDSGFGA